MTDHQVQPTISNPVAIAIPRKAIKLESREEGPVTILQVVNAEPENGSLDPQTKLMRSFGTARSLEPN
jgi:hypothetical protein